MHPSCSRQGKNSEVNTKRRRRHPLGRWVRSCFRCVRRTPSRYIASVISPDWMLLGFCSSSSVLFYEIATSRKRMMGINFTASEFEHSCVAGPSPRTVCDGGTGSTNAIKVVGVRYCTALMDEGPEIYLSCHELSSSSNNQPVTILDRVAVMLKDMADGIEVDQSTSCSLSGWSFNCSVPIPGDAETSDGCEYACTLTGFPASGQLVSCHRRKDGKTRRF
ncbi:hypothetical protein C8Q79DRAFT_981845 [Trametes meyenii]|nr:hypothetical protein C8Q79DRAFT_981845 [Trametes meyenii]